MDFKMKVKDSIEWNIIQRLLFNHGFWIKALSPKKLLKKQGDYVYIYFESKRFTYGLWHHTFLSWGGKHITIATLRKLLRQLAEDENYGSF